MLVRKQALRLMVLGMFLQLIAGFSQAGVFGLLFILAVPAFSAGMLQAMAIAGAGQRPPLSALFFAFRRGSVLPRLLLLGVLLLGCMVVAVGFFLANSLAEMDAAMRLRLESGDVTALEELDPVFIQRLLTGMALGLLAGGCLSYFAVPLIWFRGLPLGRAVGRGLLTLLRQWRALLVLGLGLGLMAVPVVVLATSALTAQAAGSPGTSLLSLLMMLAGVFYQLVVFSTQFISFSEVFGFGVPGAERPGQEDQLVA